MNSRFQEIYIHHNLFRPNNHKCSCDEFTRLQVTSENCYCVPNKILEVTNYIFGFNSRPKSKCGRFGTANKGAVKKEIGFSIHQLSNSHEIGDKRNVEDLRIETEISGMELKDYAVLLCAHFDTIILTTDAVDKAAENNSIYSTMLCDIKDAYNRKNTNNSLLMEVYFYICFCTRGTKTFSATDIVNLYKKIKKRDKTAAWKICQNLNDFEKYCKEHYNFLSTVRPYLREQGSENYLACVFQLFLDLTKYNYSRSGQERSDELCEVLNCDQFLQLFDRINTAFSHENSEHELSPECLINRIQQIK